MIKICMKVKMISVFMARNSISKKVKCKIMQINLMKKNSNNFKRKSVLLEKVKRKNKVKSNNSKKFSTK
jgi:hypothetical protein